MPMQVIALRPLREFWIKHPRAEMPLRAWYSLVSRAEWSGPADVRRSFGSADFAGDSRVIFDIGGNKWRVVAHIAYACRRVLIKFVRTHKDYDAINAETV
jgi:mRNA interferase HigB